MRAHSLCYSSIYAALNNNKSHLSVILEPGAGRRGISWKKKDRDGGHSIRTNEPNLVIIKRFDWILAAVAR